MSETPPPSAPPANAAEARTRLDGLIADKEFGAKLIAGDANANREFRALQEKADSVDPADMAAVAMSGGLPEMPDSRVKLMHETVGLLREIGINEVTIRETLEGHLVSQSEYDRVAAYKSRLMKDPVFVRDFLSGNPEARQKMTLIAIVQSGGIKDARGRF
jgi:hypothetical protein